MRTCVAMSVCLVGTAVSLSAQTVRDSAGLKVVANTRPILTPARQWRIESTPILTMGGSSADADTINEMQRVYGIARLSNGGWAVGVQASHAVRFYDPRGKFVGFAGRKGEGPGEFSQIMGVRVLRGDTLFVTDNGAVELFAPNGRFVRQGASRARGDRFIYPAVVFSDGSYLGGDYDGRTVPAAGRARSRYPLLRVSPDGERHDTVGRLQSPEQVFDGRDSYGNAVAFSGGSPLGGADDRFFIAAPDRPEIVQYALTGSAARVIRLPERNERVSDQAIRDYREWFLAMPGEDGRPMPPAMKARFAQLLDRTTYADRFPPFGSLLVDKAGNLWAQRYAYQSVFYTPGPVRTRTMSVPSTWDVLDPDGRWLCTIGLPARFTPVEIGADYVAGLARDEDEVEQVRVFRLVKP